MRRFFTCITVVALALLFCGSQAFSATSGKKGKAPAQTAKSVKAPKAAPLPPSDWSPNNFPAGNRGWCTWYTDGRYYHFFGEKLELNPRPGSNAFTWFKRAQNLEKSQEPQAGDIMVIKRPRGDRAGHVAFVEEVVPGVGWIVTHSNFDFKGHNPIRVQKIDGRKVFTDLFVPGAKPGTVKLSGGNSTYTLLGFLHRERSLDPLEELALAGNGGIGGDGMAFEGALEAAAFQVAAREEAGEIVSGPFRGEDVAYLEPATPQLLNAPDTCGCSLTPRLAN